MPKCRHRGPCVKEGAPVTRPVGVLDPAPPKGCSCVESKTKSFRFPKPQDPPGAYHRRRKVVLVGSVLVLLGRLVRYVRPSCPTWLLLGSNLAHLCSNLAQLTANLAQLGPILAQLGPTWSQNLTKMCFKKCCLASPSDLQFSIDF